MDTGRPAGLGCAQLSDPRGTLRPRPDRRGRAVGMGIDVTIAQHLNLSPATADRDHTLADQADVEREFACLVCVTHLAEPDCRRLRLVAGVTGVIDTDTTADVHMIVSARSPRAARQHCVELISDRLPEAVVTVPEVVDYNRALLSFLERHGEESDGGWATFDDAEAVAEVLDRS